MGSIEDECRAHEFMMRRSIGFKFQKGHGIGSVVVPSSKR